MTVSNIPRIASFSQRERDLVARRLFSSAICTCLLVNVVNKMFHCIIRIGCKSSQMHE